MTNRYLKYLLAPEQQELYERWKSSGKAVFVWPPVRVAARVAASEPAPFEEVCEERAVVIYFDDILGEPWQVNRSP